MGVLSFMAYFVGDGNSVDNVGGENQNVCVVWKIN